MDLRRQRLYQAGRQGLRNRMLSEWRLPAAQADESLTSWEAEAGLRGFDPADLGYWRDGTDWIAAKLGNGDPAAPPGPP